MKAFRLAILLPLSFAAAVAPAGELDRLVRQVEEARAQERRIDEERASRFLADKNRQQQILNDAKAALAKAEAESKALRGEFSANETKLGEMGAELKKQSGDLGELFGKIREFSGTFKSDLERSLTSAQFPGRAAALETLAAGKEIPDIPQLEKLWFGLLHEMNEAGKIVKFSGVVVDAAGNERKTEIYRVGAFSAFADGKFLRYAPETGKLAEAPRQPEGEYPALAKNLQNGGGGFLKVAVDPSRGGALDRLATQASAALPWVPKSLSGLLGNGIDVAIFLALLASSLWSVAVACERWLFFRRVEVGAYPSVAALETELTRRLTVIATVAANAPYVGLLGTVLGIILTFQRMGMEKGMDVHNIMIGLSTALKATAMGLIVAIPCVVLNNALRRRIRELITAYEVSHGS